MSVNLQHLKDGNIVLTIVSGLGFYVALVL